MTELIDNRTGSEIAILGMAGRFPGAKNIDEFWENLRDGKESISFFTHEELEAMNVDPGLLEDPNYVKVEGGVLEDKDLFDADFFGYTPKEAEIMDPQTRIFHECAWHALEEAGYDPGNYDGLIGLYAGAGSSMYWESLTMLSGKCEGFGHLASGYLNNKDFLATQIAYKLNLKGPVVSVQTACSTSLAAIHLACQGILNGECDMALAGGIKISIREKNGYTYQEGMINSPDGHCRAFDAKGKGFTGGEGAGVLLLKSLEDALDDGDHIHAVIKGTSINNDGLRKTGYTAPSIEGQAEAIRTAQQMAEVEPESIAYVEAHGTATELGDPVEIEALKVAFNTTQKNYCAVGSVKTNIGHLDAAAGVAGLIKTVMALKHRQLPPSLHFDTPNPLIDFQNSPFYVNNRLTPWKQNPYPRRAGVSSFGIGGTNAHAVLEESPWEENSGAPQNTAAPQKEYQLLLLSAKKKPLLEEMTLNLAAHLEKNPRINLADAAYTLQTGRKKHKHGRILVCSSVNQAAEMLSHMDSRKVRSFSPEIENPRIVFMFSGLGAQYVNMGRGLYETEPLFREEMDRCFHILRSLVDDDVKNILYPPDDSARNAQGPPDLHQFEIAQLIVFSLEYSLAKLLLKWGVKPHAMIGYSFGEYVAACIAGVFSLEDALNLIVFRGQLINKIPQGRMLSVPLAAGDLRPQLTGDLSLAIDNGPSCIIAGPVEEVAAFEKLQKEKGLICVQLPASRAIHSKMMDSILDEFKNKISRLTLNTPQFPYISNVTGTWITRQDATDPSYWAGHLHKTVRFSDGVQKLLEREDAVFIEIGPGRDLCTLMDRHVRDNPNYHLLSLTPLPARKDNDAHYLLNRLGQLWLYGVTVDWSQYHDGANRRRIPLPVYPFDPQRFSIDQDLYTAGLKSLGRDAGAGTKPDMADWFYVPSWKRSVLPRLRETLANRDEDVQWLVFMDEGKLGNRLLRSLEKNGTRAITVQKGKTFHKKDDHTFTLNPGEASHYDSLFIQLKQSNRVPRIIVHLWNVTQNSGEKLDQRRARTAQELGYYSLIHIAQAIGKLAIREEIRLKVIADNMQEVTGSDLLFPEKSTLMGPVETIPKEYSNIRCNCIDIDLAGPRTKIDDPLISQLLTEIMVESTDPVVAYRDSYRWVRFYDPVRLESPSNRISRFKEGGVYLVTGGLGGIGLAVAESLAKTVRLKLALLGRSDFPAKEEWDQWCADDTKDPHIRTKILKLKKLEEYGSEVLTLSADVTGTRQMKQAIQRVTHRFGPLNGVIHAAGIADGEMIQLKTRESSEKVIASKLDGVLALQDALQDEDLDFLILFSSISSIIGAAGHVAYYAANAFLDAYAIRQNRPGGTFTVSINWNRWRNTGIAVLAEQLHEKLTNEKMRGGISQKQGFELFTRILGEALPQVAVNPRDLPALIERSRETAAPSSHGETGEKDTPKAAPKHLHHRPENITSDYVPPANETEKSLVNIFQDFFGFEPIGTHDDFFELGGDSLKAVNLTEQLKKISASVALQDVLAHPTISQLASLIGEMSDMEQLMLKLQEEKLLGTLDCIEKLNNGQNKKNIFIVHPAHGMLVQYYDLAKELENEYNVYGIQARGVVRGAELSQSPDEMIGYYVQQVLKIQPNGPFILGGQCSGKVISYEMTIRLEKMNHKVRQLFLFNPNPFMPPKMIKNLKLLERLPNFVKKAVHAMYKKKFKKAKQDRDLNGGKIGIDELMDTHEVKGVNKRVYKNIDFLIHHMVPLEIIKAPLLIIWPEEFTKYHHRGPEYLDLSKGKVSFAKTPGDLITMYAPPHFKRMAQVISEHLREANVNTNNVNKNDVIKN